MLAIYLKELKSYFKSFFGWLFLGVFAFFSGLYMIIINFNNQNPYISHSVSSLFVVTMFVLPLLTMRVFAEEKKQKTDQLLLTAPVRLWAVVLGKFLALATMMAASCFVLIAGCLLMSLYGKIPVAESVLALGGFWLFGCICISVGMFLSSITEHQFIAAIFTYGVFIFLMLVPSFCSILFGESAWITKLLDVVDIISPFDNMFNGLVVLSDIFYILSAIAVMLILSCRVFGKNIWKIGAMGAKKYLISNVGLLVIIALIVLANFGVRKIPTAYTEFDITNKGLYTLSDTSKELVKGLNEDITIYVVGSEDELDDIEATYLSRYAANSKHIKVEYRPTDKYPGFMDQYSDTYYSPGSLVLAKGESFRILSVSDLYVYSIDYMTYTQQITGIDIEGQITAAIASLIEGTTYRVCYTQGHDEVQVSEKVLGRLRKGGYEASELVLLTDEIPTDCVAIIVNAPTNDFAPDEVEKLNDYVNEGGNLILMASLYGMDTPVYDAFVSSFGAALTKGVILERDANKVYRNNPSYLVLTPNYSSITSEVLNAKRLNFFYITRGFQFEEDNEGIMINSLYDTSEYAYMKEYNEGQSVEYEKGDESGVFSTAVYITKTVGDGKEAKIVEFGTPGFIYDDFDLIVGYANTDVFMAAVNEMSDRTLNSSVPAKSLDYEPIMVNTGMVFLYAAIFMLLLPFTLIVTGIIFVILRSKK